MKCDKMGWEGKGLVFQFLIGSMKCSITKFFGRNKAVSIPYRLNEMALSTRGPLTLRSFQFLIGSMKLILEVKGVGRNECFNSL